jgi:hypothetical protein
MDNDIAQTVPTFTDTIVDVKAALEAAGIEELVIRAAFRHMDAIVEVRDCSSWPATYVTVSKKWERWASLREHEIYARSDYDFRPRKMADKFTLVLKEVIAAGKTMSYTAGAGNEASGFRPVRFSLTPYTIDRRDFVVAIGIPITSSGDGG